MTCSIFDLPNCLEDKFFEILRTIVNAPLQPFLASMKFLLTQPPNIQTFSGLWAVFIYLISLFYGIFLIGTGIMFIVSGHDPVKRTQAKQWLQDILIMIVLVQASFLIYGLIAEIASGLSSGVYSLIDPLFFRITFDDHSLAIVDLLLGLLYLSVLICSVLLFAVNYLFASMGVLLAPIGVFLAFIPPMRDIGKFILNLIVFVLFIPFFANIILLGASELIKAGSVDSAKLWIVLAAFVIIDVLMILLALMAVVRSITSIATSSPARAVMMLKGNVLAAFAQKQKTTPEISEREKWARVRSDYPGYERRYR